MATTQEWLKSHKKEIISALLGALCLLAIIAIIFYTPRPTLIDPPSSTKENTITLKGNARPMIGIAVFDKSGNAVIIVETNNAGEFTVANLPIGEGKNIFTIRAIASRLRVSLPLTVSIEKDTVAPQLSVNNLSGANVTGVNTVISGKAEPGSVVTVNGVKTTTNPDGTWSATVALQPGKNTVTVSATDPAGNSTTDTQTIQYTPTAPGTATGTATVTTSTITTSPGSQPATSTQPGALGTATSSPTTTAGTPASTGTSSSTAPAAPTPKDILAIVATTYVSNPSPNQRANETIYATVRDNYGQPVSGASVLAFVHYKTGTAVYSLSHQGNGLYAVSFKLNDKYAPNVQVSVEVKAEFKGFTNLAYTSFIPQ